MIKNEDFLYEFKREQYGTKTLLSMEGLPHSVGKDYQKSILFRGVRFHGPECRVISVPKWTLAKDLLKFQVIGWGLPMVMEYFWERGFMDFLKKSLIALSRLLSSTLLLLRSKTYIVLLGNDPKKNVETMSQMWLKK